MKCKLCEANFTGPYALGQHRKEQHPAEVRKAKLAKKRAAVATPPPPQDESSQDGELATIASLMAVMDEASLDPGAVSRVLAYVGERNGVSLVPGIAPEDGG